MGLIRYLGGLLNRGGKLAISTRCCCDDCDCCFFDADTAAVTQFAATYTAPNGTTTGSLHSSGQATRVGTTCVGRIEFAVTWTNGGCMATETTPAVAQLNQVGGCCYWTIELTPPDTPCMGDPYDNLADGWPGDIQMKPNCSGDDATGDDCGSHAGGPCEGYCSTGGFVNTNFKTNLGGTCITCSDEGVL